MKDILVDDNNDIKILNGDFDIGESEMQEVANILQSTQGEWKTTPLLGPNLYRFINGKVSKQKLEEIISIHLGIDNKNFKELRTKIETFLNRGQ